MKHTKLKMGDVELDAVCYENGYVAHRQRKDGNPEFTTTELERLVKCWNYHDALLDACKKALKVLHLDSDMEEDFTPEITTLEAAIAAATK